MGRRWYINTPAPLPFGEESPEACAQHLVSLEGFSWLFMLLAKQPTLSNVLPFRVLLSSLAWLPSLASRTQN